MNNDNNNWQEHLERLDDHYSKNNFFEDFYKPQNTGRIEDLYDKASLFEDELLEEGQLTIDIYNDNEHLYVIAPIAGADPEKVEVTLEKDVLTIKGERKINFSIENKTELFKECYWGKFSRSIILPVPVQEEKIEAKIVNHVLILKLPKAPESQKIEIKIKK